MLVCYARELKEHFVEYTEQTVKLMVPMLKFYFHDGVRAAAAESLPCLIECAKIRGPQYVQEMWAYICPELIQEGERGEEDEALSDDAEVRPPSPQRSDEPSPPRLAPDAPPSPPPLRRSSRLRARTEA